MRTSLTLDDDIAAKLKTESPRLPNNVPNVVEQVNVRQVLVVQEGPLRVAVAVEEGPSLTTETVEEVRREIRERGR